MIALPQYIDREAWEGFESMRKTIKKPLTDRARMLVVYELQRIKDAGHDPNAALDQSTNHCWADVYPPKDKPIEHKAGSAADKTQEMLKEREARGYTAPPAELRLVADRIRRAG
jgi:hypothetical protein